MLMLNHKLTADEAHRFGMVSEVATSAELDTKLWPRVESFALLAPQSMQVTKKLLQKFEIAKLDEVCEAELTELYKRFMTEECLNAITTFMMRKSKL